MRKNSPRKWVHALLDLLPLLILPIFALAVRSDNNFQPISVQAQDYEVVDFNQLVINGKPTSLNTYSLNFENSGTLTYDSDYLVYELNTYYGDYQNGFGQFTYNNNGIYVISGHKYYNTFTAISNYNSYFNAGGDANLAYGSPLLELTANIENKNSYIFQSEYTGLANRYFYPIAISGSLSNDYYVKVRFNMLIDLTQMFGSGNEPTLEQFNSWYPNDYYEYTTSKKELLNVGTTTLSDTDVGSQMVYTLYNATDKYFNFNNVFNFGQIYDWFLLNIFNGNAALIFPVVWQIILYEFIMDLVFLIYALFMFFIDFCTNLIDRFHLKCSGGK